MGAYFYVYVTTLDSNMYHPHSIKSRGESMRCQNINVDIFWPSVGHSEVTDSILELGPL